MITAARESGGELYALVIDGAGEKFKEKLEVDKATRGKTDASAIAHDEATEPQGGEGAKVQPDADSRKRRLPEEERPFQHAGQAQMQNTCPKN